MDAVVKVFKEGLPPESVYKFRSAMRDVAAKIQTVHSALSMSVGDPLMSGRGMIVTGSMVEGANFARQFSRDDDTVTEMEFDMMLQLGPSLQQNAERDLCYLQENEAFFHIRCKKDDEEMVRLRKHLGDVWFERMTVDADGHYYANSLLIKEAFELTTKMSERTISNFVTDAPAEQSFVDFKDIVEDGRKSFRSGEQLIDLVNDCRAGGAADAQATAQTASAPMILLDPKNIAMKLRSNQQPEPETNKTVDDSDQFLQRCCAIYDKMIERIDGASSQTLNLLRIVEDELVFALNPAKRVPLRVQAAKAQEYLTTIMDSVRTLGDFNEQLISCTAHLSGIVPCEFVAALINERTKEIRDFSNRLTAALSVDPKTGEKCEAAIRSVLFEIEMEFVANGLIFMQIQTGFLRLTDFKSMWELSNKMDKKAKPMYAKYREQIGRSSNDIVACLGLDFWPRVAGEWLTRDRQWPDAATVDVIARKGVHMIGKQFCHPDIDWRLSFSVAEIELSGLWTEPQLFIYFIFKSLFYRFFVSINETKIKHKVYDRDSAAAADKQKKSLKSYFSKTVMLNVSESFPQSWWSVPNAAECLTVLLYVLKSALESRTLAHHFIPSVNLLHGIDKFVLDEAVEAIEMVLGKPEWVAAQMEPRFADIRRLLAMADDLPSAADDLDSLVGMAIRFHDNDRYTLFANS